MNEWNSINFLPSNIFTARDFYKLRCKQYGEIEIYIDGGRGWCISSVEPRTTLTDGLDVWAACRWLNEHETEYKKNHHSAA